MKNRFIALLDRAMEYGAYIYIFALFNHHTTALSRLGVYIPFLAWLIKHAITRGQHLAYLRNPISIGAFAFFSISLLSIFQAPAPFESLNSFRLNLGTIILLMLPMGDVFRQEDKARRLLWALGFSGIWVNLLQLNEYITLFRQTGKILAWSQYMDFRSYSDPLVFFMPFTLALANLSQKRFSKFWWVIFFLQAGLLVATGTRGAWMGITVAMIVWLAFKVDRRLLMAGVAALAMMAILAFVVPTTLIKGKVEQGVSTSGRVDGAWKPTVDMIIIHPIVGHGYGEWVYNHEYNLQHPSHPWWPWEHTLGSHNTYLLVTFASGVIALASMIYLFAKLFGQLSILAKIEDGLPGYLALATLASFTGTYLVRGFVENKRWYAFGVLLGLAVALLAKKRPQAR